MNLFDKTRNGLEEFLTEKSAYSPVVMTTPKGNDFPKVVFAKADDRETGSTSERFDVKSSVTFEIDIYAKAQGVSEVTIANELESLVKEYMGEYMGFRRTFDAPTPNVDVNVYRITMRYIANVNDKRNVFY